MQDQIDKANSTLSWLVQVLSLIAEEFGVKDSFSKEFPAVFVEEDDKADVDTEIIKSICQAKKITPDGIMALS